MEKKKKNKTDKERLVVSTDVQDVPAFGLEERSLQSCHLPLRQSQHTMGPSHPCSLGDVLRAGGAEKGLL